jgi:hypothetical protein
VIGILLLIAGGTTAEIDLTFEFGALDGFWFLIGLPIVVILVLVLISPLSYGIHRLLYRQRRDDPETDT